MHATRTFIMHFVKLGFAATLIAWLVSSGKLDFNQLVIVTDSPLNVAATISMWLFGMVLLGSLRWKVLLGGIGIFPQYLQTVWLTLIGLFFNSTLPGAVGGDLVKAYYVMRGIGTKRKAPAMMSILLDRITGLMGLFLLAGIALYLNVNTIAEQPVLYPLAFFVVSACGLVLCFLIYLFGPFTLTKMPFSSHNNKIVSILQSILDALNSYKEYPYTIVLATFLSIIIQSIAAFFFYYITWQMNGEPPRIGDFALIYPIGILLTALPLAPAGLGVGHFAFDRLYQLVGMSNGANAFNVYVLSTLCLNLTGVLPYLLLKKQGQFDVERSTSTPPVD